MQAAAETEDMKCSILIFGHFDITVYCDTISIFSSCKLGLDAGSSALSPPEMFRTWGRKMNREASAPRGRVRGRLVQNESTFQSDLSRLKTLTPPTSS